MSYAEFHYSYKGGDPPQIKLLWRDAKIFCEGYLPMTTDRDVMAAFYPRVNALLAAGWQIVTIKMLPLNRLVCLITHALSDVPCPFEDLAPVMARK
jgi:hypothetical protein